MTLSTEKNEIVLHEKIELLIFTLTEISSSLTPLAEAFLLITYLIQKLFHYPFELHCLNLYVLH